jgi:osmotically-inducible protein OsmY
MVMKSEEEIQKKVMEELKWQAEMNTFKPTEIGVAVRNGVVTLNGTVDSYRKKIAAEQAATAVEGVRGIANDIEVKLPDAFKKNDTEIAEAVLNIMRWNPSVPENDVRIKLEDGWVTLDGEVEWQFQKQAAKKAVENIIGVKGIINHITVSSKLNTPFGIKEKIDEAFKRNFYLDQDNIEVKVDGNSVILEGQVRSLAEKKAAEFATWSAPGIASVQNKLEVDHSKLLEAAEKPKLITTE